jgi:hypothetical protein
LRVIPIGEKAECLASPLCGFFVPLLREIRPMTNMLDAALPAGIGPHRKKHEVPWVEIAAAGNP